MKKYFIIGLFSIIAAHAIGQTFEFWDSCYFNNNQDGLKASVIRDSRKGFLFPTSGQYYMLNIFVNIVYDINPRIDPCKASSLPYWKPDTCNSINKFIPTYLLNWMDTGYVSLGPHGTFTRLFAESSFNSLLLYGDFMVINIKQSVVNNGNPFNSYLLINAVLKLINDNGGLNTLYGCNKISSYDKISKNSDYGYSFQSNNNIDVVNFYIRNSTKNFGGVDIGHGMASTSCFKHGRLKSSWFPFAC